MTKDEALKLALEALKTLHDENMDYLTRNKLGGENNQCMVFARETITAIKEALAQPEPVAWSHAGAMPPEQEEMKKAAYQLAPWLSAALDDPKVCKEYKDAINAWFDAAMPAPQRAWVGLTDEEWLSLGCKSVEEVRIGLAIQNKLKEKNS